MKLHDEDDVKDFGSTTVSIHNPRFRLSVFL